MDPRYQANFSNIVDGTTRRVFEQLADEGRHLLSSILARKFIDTAGFAVILDHRETHTVFRRLASLSEQLQHVNH